jgi:hypothetical protein
MIKSEFKTHIAATGPLKDMRYLKPSQVPRVYPISRTRLYELLNQGHVKSVKLGGARLVSVDSIEAFLARLAKEQEGKSMQPSNAQLAATEKASPEARRAA